MAGTPVGREIVNTVSFSGYNPPPGVWHPLYHHSATEPHGPVQYSNTCVAAAADVFGVFVILDAVLLVQPELPLVNVNVVNDLPQLDELARKRHGVLGHLINPILCFKARNSVRQQKADHPAVDE